jgi:hypothetical protein
MFYSWPGRVAESRSGCFVKSAYVGGATTMTQYDIAVTILLFFLITWLVWIWLRILEFEERIHHIERWLEIHGPFVDPSAVRYP